MTGKILSSLYALAAAVFYGAGIPFSKLLMKNVQPVFMAAFMYLGAGIGIGTMYVFHHRNESASESLTVSDMPYVFGMIVLDVIAPVLLMVGVNLGSSSSASLLGNFEIVFTAVTAMILFGERVSRRLWLAVVMITLSGMILSADSGEALKFSPASLMVICAALSWGIENNCTRKISGRNTYQIVTLKGLCCGTVSFVMAILTGEDLPAAEYVTASLLLGFVAYGLSIFTYIRAQKILGASRTSAYYAAAPFIGSFMSFVILGEGLSWNYAAVLAVMIPGAVLAVSESISVRHIHEHTHILLHGQVIRHTHEHKHFMLPSRHKHSHETLQ
ncbi:MAG: DMT family transporter [Synergistaceae bacterium]|nr:DMT family transporter [Synergistaceae bacterium]MBQ7170565.1 DMT family transporter [Synergistaceae bacterium]